MVRDCGNLWLFSVTKTKLSYWLRLTFRAILVIFGRRASSSGSFKRQTLHPFKLPHSLVFEVIHSLLIYVGKPKNVLK